MTKISFEADGTILVQGAPGPERNYRVAWGQVALTEEQAATAERNGWTIVLGKGNGQLAVVERSEKEWRDFRQGYTDALNDFRSAGSKLIRH